MAIYATSVGGTYVVGSASYNSIYSGYVQVRVNSINIEGNTSNITIEWIYKKNAGDPWGAWNGNTNGSTRVTLRCEGTGDTKNAPFDLRSAGVGATQVLHSITRNIGHGADGSGFVYIGGNHVTGLNPPGWGTVTVPDVQVFLPTIPRASSISGITGSVAAGGTVTVSIDRKAPAFTHKVAFTLGQNIQVFTNVGTAQSFTIPLNWCTSIPNATSGTAAVTVTTMNGGTQIGNPVSASFTVTVPASLAPSVSSFTATRINTDTNADWGIYLQSKSRVRLTAAAAGSYGSAIVSYQISGDWYSGTGSVLETGPINNYGTVGYTVTVTDSRGRTASKVIEIYVYAYAPPRFEGGSYCYRANAGGAQDDNGGYLGVKSVYTVSSCNGKNTHNTHVRWKKATGGGFNGWQLISNNTAKVFSGLSPDDSYLVELKCADWFTATVSTYTVSSSLSIIDIHKSGKGLGFGEAAEAENLISCAWPVRMRLSNNYAPYGGGFIFDGSASTTGVLIKLPYTLGSDHMVLFTVNVYGSYSPYKIRFSGYMYNHSESNYNWFGPRAELISGDSYPLNVRMGKAADGRLYVWIAGLQYMGITVTDITGTYKNGDWSRGWEFVRTNDTPNTALNIPLRKTGYVRVRLSKPAATTAGTWMIFKNLPYNDCAGTVRINPSNGGKILIDRRVHMAIVHISLASTGASFNAYPRIDGWGPASKNVLSQSIGRSLNQEFTFVNMTGNQGVFDCQLWSGGGTLDFSAAELEELYWHYLDVTVVF